MKKKMIIAIVIGVVLLSILLLIGVFFIPNNKTVVATTISIDINPSIEINLDKKDKVIDVVALNDDAKNIVIGDYKGKDLKTLFSSLIEKLVNEKYIDDDRVIVLVHSEGSIDTGDIISKLADSFWYSNIDAEMVRIDKITEDDEKLAKEYNISPAKAAFINLIKENNKDADIEKLSHKNINELKEMKETGNYCDEGYFLEGFLCYKEINRIEASTGNVCPRDYIEHNNICYREAGMIDGTKDVCPDDFEEKDGKCERTESRIPNGICESGNYDEGQRACFEDVYIGDAYEFCRDPGRTLMDHKCLATKPSINGGCLGNDLYYNGTCLNTRDDYYMSEWMCPNGKINSNADGSLLFEDNKCTESKKTEAKLECESGFTLEGDSCIKHETKSKEKERVCPKGYTMIENQRCIDLNDSKDYIDGFVCNQDNSKVKGNECVIYEVIEAKHY